MTRSNGGYEVAVDYDSGTASEMVQPSSELKRLQDLTRRLEVPKTELDEKRAAD